MKVQECSGCAFCEETGLCRLQDEMSLFWSAFGRSTHLVFACPVYFYGVPAGAKAVIDRCQSRWSRKYRRGSNRQPGTRLRPGYFIAAAGSRGKRVFEGVRLTARYFFDAIDVGCTGELLYAGVDEKGDIQKHPTALKESFAAGEGFV
jgi:multimeric flavodoxin WrbA